MLQTEIINNKKDAPKMDVTLEYTEEELRNAFKDINENPKETLQFLTQYMFAQHRVTNINNPDLHKDMTAKAGVQKFGEAAVRALAAEFTQLHNLDDFKFIDP